MKKTNTIKVSGTNSPFLVPERKRHSKKCIYECIDPAGNIHKINIHKHNSITAKHRAGKTTLACLVSRFASNNNTTTIYIAPNLTAAVADFTLKHRWQNAEGVECFLDESGVEHHFILEPATQSKSLMRDLERPGQAKIYHILKNTSSIRQLKKLLDECKLKEKSVLIIVDEAHHAMHIEYNNTPVSSNILLKELYDELNPYITLFGITASGNTVRDMPIWQEHHNWESKETYDLIEDTVQTYVSQEEYELWRYKKDRKSILPDSVEEFIIRQLFRPGIALVTGQREKVWQNFMSNEIKRLSLEQGTESAIIAVNSSKYLLHTKGGTVAMQNSSKDSNLTQADRQVKDMITAIEMVMVDHPNLKIFVVTHVMGHEGTSYRDGPGTQCLTGFVWCPPVRGMDDSLGQQIHRIEVGLAKENNWEVEICTPENQFLATVNSVKDSLHKDTQKASGEKYDTPTYRSPYIQCAMDKKAAQLITTRADIASNYTKEEKQNFPLFTTMIEVEIPEYIDVDGLFNAESGRRGKSGQLLRYLHKLRGSLGSKVAYRDEYAERWLGENTTRFFADRFIFNAGDNCVYVVESTEEGRENLGKKLGRLHNPLKPGWEVYTQES